MVAHHLLFIFSAVDKIFGNLRPDNAAAQMLRILRPLALRTAAGRLTLAPSLHGLTDRIGDHIAWRPTTARTGAPWVCGILSANNSTILSVSSDAPGSRIASSE